VDAAIAAALVAAVAESPLTGPGAGGFLLARLPGAEPVLLDFFVAVPGLGPRGRALDPADLESFTVPFGGADQVFHIGPASVAVPGMLPGLGEASRRLGRLPLTDLVAPAAALARDGVVLAREQAHLHRILAEMLTNTPGAAAVYAPRGTVRGQGERLVFPDLANTLEAFGRDGPGLLATGPAATALLDGLGPSGLVTAEDLAAYRVEERVPVRLTFRDVTVLTNPPPASGGVLVAAALHDLDRRPRPASETDFYLGVARAGRRANALRSPGFASEVGSEGFLERFWAAIASAQRHRRPTGTTHVSAIDPDGGMASLSSSNGSGSGVVVPGLGFLLNNMLGEEDLNPAGCGALPPGARMTSMMAPTLLLKDGAPFAAVGSAGSNRLRSAILQTVAAMVDTGAGARAAVHRPRVHPEGGEGIDVEGGVPPAAVEALAGDGFELRVWDELNLFFGGVAAAALGPYGLEAAGDPRRGGGAAGITDDGRVVAL
jgi:gamma-glutamyltranspeptidase/glutathione hydrolase